MVTLQEIETFVLVTVGYTRYTELSAATGDEQIEDFSLLHRCVHLARQALMRNTKMLGNLVWDNITITKGIIQYDAPNDFDIPVHMVWVGADGSTYDLKQLYIENMVEVLGKPFDLTEEGAPEYYLIVGQDNDLVQIGIAPSPNQAGSIGLTYHAIMASLTTSTDETVDMKKYPETIINLAAAYAFQLFKKDKANFDKYYLLGSKDFPQIDFREKSADSNFREIPDSLTRRRRMGHFSR